MSILYHDVFLKGFSVDVMWLSFWDQLKLNPKRADYMDFQGLTLDFKEIVHVVIIKTLPIFF